MLQKDKSLQLQKEGEVKFLTEFLKIKKSKEQKLSKQNIRNFNERMSQKNMKMKTFLKK